MRELAKGIRIWTAAAFLAVMQSNDAANQRAAHHLEKAQ
jgi:hypothetical protein